jgi:DNA repair photolyase
MFKSVTRTWNPFVGCLFQCTYCWARRLAETKLKDSPRYRDGFQPKPVEEELTRQFKPGEFVFVSDMGDIAWASRSWVVEILERIMRFPQTDFLLQSKNPRKFSEWHLYVPANVYLGTTIETTEDYGFTKAPPPWERYLALASLRHPRKFISIEPIMDFRLDLLTEWIEKIGPDIVEVGYDNYNNRLTEPKLDKTLELIQRIGQFTKVEKKTIRKAWDE